MPNSKERQPRGSRVGEFFSRWDKGSPNTGEFNPLVERILPGKVAQSVTGPDAGESQSGARRRRLVGLAIILLDKAYDRIEQLEDRIERLEKGGGGEEEAPEETTSAPPPAVGPYSKMDWQELVRLVKERGITTRGQKTVTLIEALTKFDADKARGES